MKRYISTKHGWQEVDARKIKSKHGLDLFFYRYDYLNSFEYVVCEGSSGMRIFNKDYIKDCTETELLKGLKDRNLTLEKFKSYISVAVKKAIKECGEKPND